MNPTIKSSALDAQSVYTVEVEIDQRYAVLQEIMSKYYGIMEGLNTLLKEVSHPHRNWEFIVKEARAYSLDYFHLLKNHPKGGEGALRFAGMFAMAIEAERSTTELKAKAADGFLLLLQKIITESGPDLRKFIPVIQACLDRMMNCPGDQFFLFVKSHYEMKKLARMLLDAVRDLRSPDQEGDEEALNATLHVLASLLVRYHSHSHTYWLSEEDPYAWFDRETSEMGERKLSDELFKEISHEEIRRWKAELDQTASPFSLLTPHASRFTPHASLLELPGYNQIVAVYKDLPQRLMDAGQENGRGMAWKMIFLLHMMNIPGLSDIHEEVLREINRTLCGLISNEGRMYSERIIEKTFSIVRARVEEFPATALDCVLNMGKGVYESNTELITFFIDSVIDLGFQAPMIEGVGNDWQIRVNATHLQNTRTWLQLIELSPKWSTRLLSYLIIHLSLCGVFIKDTDLFPRDITRLLNTNIEPAYNLVKQLAKLFPVYFNDIGAEGELRDISTRIDEVTHRKDILIHFLRKQVHVESSNRTIGFMDAVFHFWTTREKEVLRPFVPPNIYDQLESDGLHVDGMHHLMSHLKAEGMNLPEDFLASTPDDLENRLSSIRCQVSSVRFPDPRFQIPDADFERVKLAASLYQLLRQKYDLSSYSRIGIQADHSLSMLKNEWLPNPKRLKEALAKAARPGISLKRKIVKLLSYLESLKKLILSPESYEIREDIYKKRHFTVDIPSMYGSYHEPKFDALGLTFRIEALVNVLFEELVESTDLSLITKATFYEIFARLRLFNQALKVDGISTVEMDRQLDFLAHSIELREFSFTQYLDIFKGFTQAVRNIINDHFNNVHEENLNRILCQIPFKDILPKYTGPLSDSSPAATESGKHRISEIFSRERISSSLGLQQLDVFLTRVLNTLFHQADKLHRDHLRQLLLYDPQSAIRCIDERADNAGIIYLGNKGLNLIRLKNYGLPVPPGFIITTEVFRFREMIESYGPARRNFREQVSEHILVMEKATHKVFGNPGNPLLLSVRSGSSISQPGMMDTFLNVGINEEITAGLAARTENAWFAWDNYRRFLQCHGMSYGLVRDDFDAIIGDFKKRKGVLYKSKLTGEQMRTVALAYKQMIRDAGIQIVEEPFEQLITTIKRVFSSWESPKAKAYRGIMEISDDWGTAVTVQAMVFGNLSPQSGTGVFFTHNPRWAGENLRLWGDFTIGNQGEDVVSGLVTTLPISIDQQDIEMRDTDTTLESHFPEIYEELERLANTLVYEKGWSPQEMEFTFEGPSVAALYLLQTRDMAIRERKKAMTFEAINGERPLGHGIGVSGGAMSGRVIFTVEEIENWRHLEPETSLILLRGDTVPDDIREIHAADGLLTARGGLTSHAAVVAHRLGKTCVVGCGSLVCDEKRRTGRFDQVMIRSGDFISIDGRQGSVYQGRMKMKG